MMRTIIILAAGLVLATGLAKSDPSDFFSTSNVLEELKEEECQTIKGIFPKLLKLIAVMIEDLGKGFSVKNKIQLDNLEITEAVVELVKNYINFLNRSLNDFYSTGSLNSSSGYKVQIFDILVATVRGILEDGLLKHGYKVINNHDLREWLLKHGAKQDTVNSNIIKYLYDLVVSYRNGNKNEPDMEAGTSLKYFLLGILCYDGVPALKMKASHGDVVFGPIYQVLIKRGVKFRFFHKVEELILHPYDKSLVEEIQITKQVDLLNEEYNPLIDVKGLPSWPNEPKYEEIYKDQAMLLQENQIDLESFLTDWFLIYQEHFNQSLSKITLKRGHDFDIIGV